MYISRMLLIALLFTMMAVLVSGPSPGWGQTTPAEISEEGGEVKEKPVEKVPPPIPAEAPGYFPKGLGTSPANTLELSAITTALGPTTGALAPYGNPAAYDTLIRGWKTRKLGPFKVTPFLQPNVGYRSNVFNSNTDRQSAFVASLNPGVRFELPVAQRHAISLGYLGNWYIFSRFSNLDHFDQNVNLNGMFNFAKMSLLIGNAFRYGTEEPSGRELRDRPYYRNTPYVQAAYKVGEKLTVQGSYQFDLLSYLHEVDQINSFNAQTGGVGLFYKFWPKTSALVQYVITARQFPNSPEDNNIIHTPLIGLTWDPTAKISGTVKFGASLTNYSESIPGRNNSPSSFVMSVNTLYRYSRYTTFNLTLQRSIQNDTDSINNDAFINTGIFLTLSHDWHKFKTTTYASIGYNNNYYVNSSLAPGTNEFERRLDNVIFLGAGLGRPLTKWLRLQVDYAYIIRSSNFSGFSYNDNRLSFGCQLSF
jgi:hypothetical protein